MRIPGPLGVAFGVSGVAFWGVVGSFSELFEDLWTLRATGSLELLFGLPWDTMGCSFCGCLSLFASAPWRDSIPVLIRPVSVCFRPGLIPSRFY